MRRFVLCPTFTFLCSFSLSVSVLLTLPASAQEPYLVPPREVVEILDAPPLPAVRPSPDGTWLLLSHRESMPGISELAVPMLRLGGHRVNPRTNGPYRTYYSRGLGFSLIRVADGEQRRLDVPDNDLVSPFWAPDSRHFAFLRSVEDGIELWVVNVDTGAAHALSGPEINAARSRNPCGWMPDGAHIICQVVREGRGEPPPEPTVPIGPVIQESSGVEAPVWTLTNLLQSPHDEALYDYYMTSQPVIFDVNTGTREDLGSPGIYETLEASPSGEYFLAIRIVRPYSYLLSDDRFPKEVKILDSRGDVIHSLASLPLDNSGVSMGWASAVPRRFSWRAGEPATLIYAEALDGGNPKQDAQYRDRLLELSAPFTGEPIELIRTESRLRSTIWGEDGLALVSESEWSTRRERTWILDTSNAEASPTLLWDVSGDDWYANPGRPVTTTTPSGDAVILQDGDWIYLTGSGGSPEGDRPFLDRLNLKTQETERLFLSSGESYETVVAVLDPEAERILTTYETPDEPPNYYLRDLKENTRTALTAFPHPAPQLAGVKKERIEYVRDDGLPLRGDLYYPVGYQEGSKVPVVVWAYPREFASTQGAGQVRGSPYQFHGRVTGPSHMLFLTQGYAVLDNASMPVVGGLKANDTFTQQLAANAKAAVDKLVEMGVTDPDRVGVGGHSYGAFMTANLLAHSDVFAAGIARSGAYNRSLTPFGFQRERRTFWEAPELYFQMSAFMHAEKINEPMLLIHGEIDSNWGTFPVQSERMFHAIKGLGGTVRLVMLPYEDHGYDARESVLHAVAEMFNWFDRYVKKVE